jgi:hypothetical protein
MLIGLEFYLAYFIMILCTVGGGGLVALSCWASRNQMSGSQISEGLYALSAAIASSIVGGVVLVGCYLVGRGGVLFYLVFGIYRLSVLATVVCMWIAVYLSNSQSTRNRKVIRLSTIALAIIDSLCTIDMINSYIPT